MDREKDIGPIYNLYADNNEISNKNNIINNDNRISDIENSITASLIEQDNRNGLIVYICNDRTIICVKLIAMFIGAIIMVFGLYYIINTYFKN
jgi:hypothetical protein